jgi:DNA-binding NarL/FixJ family response regulator
MIRIILVENHKVMLASLAALLTQDTAIKVVGQVDNVAALFALLAEKPQVDLIISDILMPNVNGIEMIRLFKEKGIELPVILLSMLEDEKYSSEAFLAGADAYLTKNVEAEELIFAIKTVMKGKRYFAAELGINVLERYHRQLIGFGNKEVQNVSFSDRELGILELIAEGSTNQQMADQLFLSRRTVEGIRQSILDKTGAKNTAALIKFAIYHGYIA